MFSLEFVFFVKFYLILILNFLSEKRYKLIFILMHLFQICSFSVCPLFFQESMVTVRVVTY